MEKFKDLGIAEPILKSIEEQFFEEPTQIQEMAIPPIIQGKDIIGGAATGSGKTLAFGCGIIQNTRKGKGIQALVLTPTRELAEQVHESLKTFSRHKSLKIAAIYGGVSINPQIQKLKIADIVVATPGRLLDHIERGTIDLMSVKTLVLDEADRMLDMGFIEDVEAIIDECPENRQTLLFSATVSKEIKRISRNYMRDPLKIFAESQVDPEKLEQVYYNVDSGMKFSLLVNLLENEKSGLVMIFCNTRKYVDNIAKNLKHNDIDALAIHGGYTQAKRKTTMKKFNSNKAHALVCTDVAARGLDIPYVSHVYNYDMPQDPNEYVHRIGRTARAGRGGKVINIVTSRDAQDFNKIKRSNKKFNIIKEDLPEIEKVRMKDSNERKRSGKRRTPKSSGYRKRSKATKQSRPE